MRCTDEKNWPVYEAVRDVTGEARVDLLVEAQEEMETLGGDPICLGLHLEAVKQARSLLS